MSFKYKLPKYKTEKTEKIFLEKISQSKEEEDVEEIKNNEEEEKTRNNEEEKLSTKDKVWGCLWLIAIIIAIIRLIIYLLF